MSKLILKITLGALILVAAAIPTHFFIIEQYSQDVDVRVKPLYDAFVQEAKKQGRDVSKIGIEIKFSEINNSGQSSKLGETTLGQCNIVFGLKPRIVINELVWNNMSSTMKEKVIYHELGHCFLLKGHTNEVEHNRHKSLMNRLAFGDPEYIQNKDEYMTELFAYEPYHVADYFLTFFITPAVNAAQTYKNKVKVAFQN